MRFVPFCLLVMFTAWLAGCRQTPTNTPCEQCRARRNAPSGVLATQGDHVVITNMPQGPTILSMTDKEKIIVVSEEPGTPPPPMLVPVAQAKKSADTPILTDGPPPLPIPAPAQDEIKVKTVAGTVPLSSPAMPVWTSPSDAAPDKSSPAAVPSLPSPATLPTPARTESKSPHVYSHSDDYGVLVGQVQPWRNSWRLRYADFGVEDQHGGNVVLVGGNQTRLQEGCYVRVQGRLIPATDRVTPARFQVQSIEVLGR